MNQYVTWFRLSPLFARARPAMLPLATYLLRRMDDGAAQAHQEGRRGLSSLRQGRDPVGRRAERLRLQNHAGRKTRLLSLLSNPDRPAAERWGLRADGSNPTRHVEKYRERHRERYLSQEELVRLGDALKEAERTASEDRFVISAIRLLLFTGCRLPEILELRWPWVNMERKRWSCRTARPERSLFS